MKDEKLKPFATRQSELSVQDGCVLWGNRVVVPKAGQAEVLIELYEAYLILIDAHSKWLEVHPMATITASATVDCLCTIFARFGPY